MAKYVVNKAGRVLHPTIVTGYLRERSGVWYCSYKNTLRSTGIRAGKETIARAMAFLENFAEEIERPQVAQTHIADVLPLYLAQQKARLSPLQFKRIKQFFAQYFAANVAMTDFTVIRSTIIARQSELAHGAETYSKRVRIFGAFFRASGASAFLPGARGGSPGARAESWVPPDAGGAGVVRGQGPLKAPRP